MSNNKTESKTEKNCLTRRFIDEMYAIIYITYNSILRISTVNGYFYYLNAQHYKLVDRMWIRATEQPTEEPTTQMVIPVIQSYSCS